MTITPERIAELLLVESPGWCRAGLTAPDERMRERAADELASLVYSHLEAPEQPAQDARQMTLPLQ
ncbi:hypothetical protein GGR39_003445 [Novosphingobium fluoreni]|uniref:Uncharacterized protein n=1 Tax=Novosphingobium fluoreni TaxID=1391222 RepID=A0A7W6C1J4_9SPHN|nr:DUF6771 family protein [Novosphingobium fluoreni]MBB3941764.1 hypothetical protein [Novosphingobium fluoreni]